MTLWQLEFLMGGLKIKESAKIGLLDLGIYVLTKEEGEIHLKPPKV